MKLNDAKEIYIGTVPVEKVYLGEELIWPPQRMPEPDIPDIYQRILAIESKTSRNTPCIKTNYYQKATTKIVMDFRMYECMDYPLIHYPLIGSLNCGWTVWGRLSDEPHVLRFLIQTKNGTKTTIDGAPLEFGTRYKFTLEKNYLIIDDGAAPVTLYNGQFIEDTPDQHTDAYCLFLGCFAVSSIPSPMRLYSCQIYEENVLVRDFVPVIEIATGKAGVYDTIEKKFYTGYYQNPLLPPNEYVPILSEQ